MQSLFKNKRFLKKYCFHIRLMPFRNSFAFNIQASEYESTILNQNDPIRFFFSLFGCFVVSSYSFSRVPLI
jgi:hypothetical protein